MNKQTQDLQEQFLVAFNQGFRSSSGTTPEFAAFSKLFHSYLKSGAKDVGLKVASYSRGHFDASAFIEAPNGKLAYISISDVRHNRGAAAEQLLYRTAEHLKDFSGGRNLWVSLDSKEMFNKIKALLEA